MLLLLRGRADRVSRRKHHECQTDPVSDQTDNHPQPQAAATLLIHRTGPVIPVLPQLFHPLRTARISGLTLPLIQVKAEAQKHHQQAAAGGILIAPAGQHAENRKKYRPQRRMLQTALLSGSALPLQPVTVQRDEAHDDGRAPEIIAGSRLPQHRLAEHHAKHPQKQIDQKINRDIIFLFMLHIPVNQQSEQDKYKGIRHIEHHLVRQQKKSQNHMAYRASGPRHILGILLSKKLPYAGRL